VAKTVTGLFDTNQAAQAAVQDLIDNGVQPQAISLIASDARGEFKNYRGRMDSPSGDFSTPDSSGSSQGAEGPTAGAVGGGLLGGALGLLVGLGALAIPGIGPVLAAGPLAAALGSAGAGAVAGAGLGAVGGGLIGGLVGMGIPDEDAQLYAEGVRRGGTLVVARVEDKLANRVAQILEGHGAVDIDQRGAEWRQSGWSGFDANAEPYSAQELDTFRAGTGRATANTASARRTRDGDGQAVLPVVEEELDVSKRQVERKGVRVHTHVEERPVEQQVNLREERISVERRPVDRALDTNDPNLFQEQSFEVTETAEEAVVQKRARVVEEVVIGKDVRERTETVRDTVRRQDVEVDETAAGRSERAVGTRGFEAYDADFRNHFKTNYTGGAYTYDQYTPVYRYGYSIGEDPRFRDSDWGSIEGEARRHWEERNPNTWEEFKDSIRYAWDKARGRA
jgi:uncharacterized protein (TIGR02271 family)